MFRWIYPMSNFSIAYPDWWQDGVKVIGRDGMSGTLSRGSSGWTVEFPSDMTGQGIPIRRYFANPHPRDWSRTPELRMSHIQAKQVAYETDRAFLTAIGRGRNGPEWASVPESKKYNSEHVYAHELAGDGYADVRQELVRVVNQVLKKYMVD